MHLLRSARAKSFWAPLIALLTLGSGCGSTVYGKDTDPTDGLVHVSQVSTPLPAGSPAQTQPRSDPALQTTGPERRSSLPAEALSNEFRILTTVQEVDQRLQRMEALLSALSQRIEGLSARVTALTQSQQQIAGQLQSLQAGFGYPPPGQRWELALQGQAVVDRESGLVWVRAPGPSTMPAPTSVLEGVAMCGAFWAGRNDWRMPTLLEMASLIDVSGTVSSHPFMDIAGTYWTTTLARDSLDAPLRPMARYRTVTLSPSLRGEVGTATRLTQHRALCVRGGGRPSP